LDPSDFFVIAFEKSIFHLHDHQAAIFK